MKAQRRNAAETQSKELDFVSSRFGAAALNKSDYPLGSAPALPLNPEAEALGCLADLELPSDWCQSRLGDLFEIQQGKAVNQRTRDGDNQQPFLRTANVFWGRLGLATLDHMHFSPEEQQRLVLKPGDLLTCEGGDVGRTAIWRGDLEQCFHQNHVHRLRTQRPDVEPEFYMRWMEEAVTLLGLYAGAHNTTTIPNLSKNRLAGFAVPHPPLPEQRAIAGVLRTGQGAKEACEQVLAATRQLKQSLLHHLFTYGPVPFEQAVQVELRTTEFGDVPASWPASVLSGCAHVQTGVAKGRNLDGSEVVELPYLRVANVQDGRLDLTEMKTIQLRQREVDRFLLQPGDVVLTEGGDFDKLGRGFIWQGQVSPCVHQNHIFAVRPNRAKLLPEFLACLAQSSYGKAYFLSVAHKTTNLACINTTKLKALPVLLPPLPE